MENTRKKGYDHAKLEFSLHNHQKEILMTSVKSQSLLLNPVKISHHGIIQKEKKRKKSHNSTSVIIK